MNTEERLPAPEGDQRNKDHFGETTEMTRSETVPENRPVTGSEKSPEPKYFTDIPVNEKRRRIRWPTVWISFLVFFVLLGTWSGVYFVRSHGSPRFFEILAGSVLLSLLLGLMSTLVERFMERGFRKGPWALSILALAFLTMLMALLVRVSNSPQNISAEIPVVYLLDLTTHNLLLSDLRLSHG
ncbi:MAG: hypothetical protein ABFE13_04505 [Phycisphaerales bacterium]